MVAEGWGLGWITKPTEAGAPPELAQEVEDLVEALRS